MINKLHIENFRGIKRLELKDFKRINIFSGKNNSGKTSILEALLLLLKIEPSFKALTLVHGLRGFEKPSIKHLETLFRGEDLLTEIYLSFKLDNKIVRKVESKNSNVIPQKVFLEGFLLSNEVLNGAVGEVLSHSFDIFLKLDVLESNFDLMSNYDDKVAEFFASILINDQLLMKGTAERVRKLILEKKQADLIKVLQQIDPQIVDIYADENEVSLDVGLERFISANVAGDGLKKLISIISAIYINKGGVVLIDEIENGLHYSAQQKLWEAIIIAAQTFDVQIFATTHSYESLQALNVVLHQESNKNKDLVSFTRLDKKGEDTKAYMVHQELFHTAIESQLEIR